ncbi:MAG TPA: inner membrane CreD family protein [Candidatus Limnocylindrales bacterium]|nr:inner membrane CreD family protein [Candidatus Limnocylindrales bacterium]
MLRRIIAIAAIFFGASLAWAILGSTIFLRTDSAGSSLSGRVASTWGAAQEQASPEVQYVWTESQTVTAEENGKKITREEKKERGQPVSLDSTRIEAQLHVDYRQKGLLWFSTYTIAFHGEHAFHNPTSAEQIFVFRLPLPAEQAVYDGLSVSLDGKPLPLTFSSSDVSARAVLPGGGRGILTTAYRSQGQKSWRYRFGQCRVAGAAALGGAGIAQANDFHMTIKTDFSGFDFPDNSLSPTEKRKSGDGWQLRWDYQNLVSGYDIALTMPEKLQPGPLAGEISYFAPVSLLFFFFIVLVLSELRGIELHPMNYFFLAGAFFAFHLLLAYLADHISIHLAFAISSLVSILLVVSYLRLVVNWRFALVDAGLAQLVYLVLFSYAFFFAGFTGLAVTVGSILSLFVVMQMTGRIRWSEKFSRPAATAASVVG